MLKSTVASMSLVLIGAVSVEAVKTFTLPESKLLFGNYNDLRIATPDSVQQIAPTATRSWPARSARSRCSVSC